MCVSKQETYSVKYCSKVVVARIMNTAEYVALQMWLLFFNLFSYFNYHPPFLLRPKTLALLFMLVTLRTHSIHSNLKISSIQCNRNDSIHIPHEFYEPGDLIIGGIASQNFFHHKPLHFTQQPSQMLINEAL